MTRRQIPKVPPGDTERKRFDDSIKERIQLFSGELGVRLALLDPATATVSDCAKKINEVILLLQGER